MVSLPDALPLMTVANSDTQGGLDCRCLASNLHDHTFRILSITTISTPHRGSSFANHFLETVGPERFPSFLYLIDMLPNGGGDGSAFECLTPAAMREFNEQTRDVPGVTYFSWGAEYSPGLIDTFKSVQPTSFPSTFVSPRPV
jgi:triacylglycerol lipase